MARRKKKQPAQQQAWAEWLKDDMPASSRQATTTTGFKVNPSMGLDDVDDDAPSDEVASTRVEPLQPRQAPKRPDTHMQLGDTLQSPQKHVQPKKPLADSKPDQDIAIHIEIPKLSLPTWRPTKRQLKWAVTVVLLVIALFGSRVLLSYLHSQSTAVKKKSSTTAEQKLNFVPLTPGDSSSQTVKSTATYSADKGIYQFRDTYKGIPLLISEQPAPDSLLQNPSSLAGIAQKSINAKDSFTTTSGTVYVGTLDTGQQRLVFQQRQLLVFIYSSATIDNASWVAYIQSLQ